MTIAERLDHLFKETAGPNGRPITLQDIIDRMTDRGIATMSLSYLQQLRSGKAVNPRVQHLRALADAFGVPLSYFVVEQDEESAAILEEDLTPAEMSIALRAHGLSESALRSIRSVIELARKGEGLDRPPTQDQPR